MTVPSPSKPITIVSGLPRSGTSLMMQALEAGGMTVLADSVRSADDSNPRGYYELEKVKAMERDSSWIDEAQGRVVKVISMLLYHLPPGRDYRVIFMTRRIEEVLASQKTMLQRLGQGSSPGPSDAEMSAYFERHLKKLDAWLATRPDIRILHCSYNALVRNPADALAPLPAFVGQPLQIASMIAAVEPQLYRARG